MLRGIEARCAACGQRRPPLTTKSLTLAGQPSRIGGVLASASGAAVLVVGLSLAIFLGLLLQSLFPAGFYGWAVAVPTAIVTLFVGLALMLTGRSLRKQGVSARRQVQFDAIRALAAHRGGAVTALEAAGALDLSEEECDALLTELAKDPKENVSLDVDDDGQIHFLFGIPEKRFRVLDEQESLTDGPAEALDETASPADRRARR